MNPVFVEVPKNLSTVAAHSLFKIAILLSILLPLAWYEREAHKVSSRFAKLPIEQLGFTPKLYRHHLPAGISVINARDLLVEKEGVFALYKSEDKILYLIYPSGFQKIAIPSDSSIQSIEFDPSGIFLYIFDFFDAHLRIRKIACNDIVLQSVAFLPLPQEIQFPVEIIDTKISKSKILLCINQDQLWNISLQTPSTIKILNPKLPLLSFAESNSQILQKVFIRKNQSEGFAFLVFSSSSPQGERSIFLREYDFISHQAGDTYSLGVAKGTLLGIDQDKYVVWSKSDEKFFYCIFQTMSAPQGCTIQKIPIHSYYQIAGVFSGQWSTVATFLTHSSIEFCAWNIRGY